MSVDEILSMCGASTLEEAAKSWHAERLAMLEMHERNKVLIKYIDLLWPIISACGELFERIAVSPAAMFLPPILSLKIEKVSQLITEAKKVYAEMNTSSPRGSEVG